jgi:hypothetical protein
MCDTSPYCPNDNLERRHSTYVKHKRNNKNSFIHTTVSITSTMSTKYHEIYNIMLRQQYHILKQWMLCIRILVQFVTFCHLGGVYGFLTSTLYQMEVLLKVFSVQCHTQDSATNSYWFFIIPLYLSVLTKLELGTLFCCWRGSDVANQVVYSEQIYACSIGIC